MAASAIAVSLEDNQGHNPDLKYREILITTLRL